MQILSEETSYTDNYRFIGSFWAEAQIIKGLTVRASYNNDSAYTYDYIYYNQNHPYAADKGRILDRNRFVMTNTIDLYANYNRKIGEDFSNSGPWWVTRSSRPKSRTSYIDAQNYPRRRSTWRAWPPTSSMPAPDCRNMPSNPISPV